MQWVHWASIVVIAPHGSTDLVTSFATFHVYTLLRCYLVASALCFACWQVHPRLHYVPFLVSSCVHFASDCKGSKRKRLCTSVTALAILSMAATAFYNFAKTLLVVYMICIHVPLHYVSVHAKLQHSQMAQLQAFVSVVIFTIASIIQGPALVTCIEEAEAMNWQGVACCSVVVGHVLYTDATHTSRMCQ